MGVVRWLGIHRFRLRDDQGQSLIDHGGIWLLELNKVTVQVVETDQQRWLKFFVEGDRLDDEHLPAWMNTEEMQQAMNTLKAFSEKTRAYHRYQARQNYLRQQHIPPERLLTLAVDSLSWSADTAPPPDGLLQLELYCNLSYPRPLILPAQVVDSSPLPDSGWHIQARFHTPSPALQEALERYIFLQHRRAIASQRRHPAR